MYRHVDILDALVYLENNDIVHGNIHPASIFCKNVDNVLHAKLGNMTVSHKKETALPSFVDRAKIVDKRFMAPEVLAGGMTSGKSDVWSYGITLWVSISL